MAIYQTKKCPKCGRVYERNSYAGHPSKENRIKYGSPIKQCRFCNTLFVDDEYREIEIEGIREVDLMKVSPQTMVMSGLVIFIGFGCMGNQVIAGLVMIVLGVIVVWLEYSGFEKRKQKLQKMAEESKERLSNPTYALALKQLGYEIPEKYINSTMKEEYTEER